MPEGDTIFRAARTLALALEGKVVRRFSTVLPQLARIDEDAPIAGRTIESVRAAGKHLLMKFSGGFTLRTHLQMNGSWHLYRPQEQWRRARTRARIVIETEDFIAIGFDLSRAEFLDEQALRRSEVSRLGPDLLGKEFDAAEARRRILASASISIAEALLQQRNLAGIGNVYKSEVLFLCRVDPFAAAAALDEATIDRVVAMARKLLLANVREDSVAGIVTRQTTGRRDPAERLWVYGRGKKPCRKCGTPILRAKQGIDARSTYWCPRCQPPVFAARSAHIEERGHE